MATVAIRRNKNGETVIKNHGVKALVCHLQSGPKGVTVYPLSGYTDMQSAANEITAQDPSFSKKYLVDLCNSVWGSLWK
jgi:poly-gamma-glutamate synthesis protein (capsule biosynthesis protein)